MKKGVDTRTLSAEILRDCGNCLLETLNSSCICFLKLKYYGTFTYIIQYDHSNAHLNLIKVTNHAYLRKLKTLKLRKFKIFQKRVHGKF